MHFTQALVTGASSGLGKAFCQLLIAKGIPVCVTARNLDTLHSLRQEQNIAADLSKAEERQPLLRFIRENTPDLVVNNAGFGLYGKAIQLSFEEQKKMLAVNCEAVMEITLAAAKALHLAKKRGTILNIASAAAFLPFPTFSTYAASKAFVSHFSQALDAEMKPHGIRILTACPGQILTDFASRASKQYYAQENAFALTAEKAAQLLWRQIEKGKRLYLFDWRTHLLITLARLLPQRLLDTLLLHSLHDRIKSDKA